MEPHIDEVSNIFAKHPTGAQFFNDAAHFRPEITGSENPCFGPIAENGWQGNPPEIRVIVSCPVFSIKASFVTVVIS